MMGKRNRSLPEWQIQAMSQDMAENPYRFAVTYDLDDYYSFFEIERRRVRWAVCKLLLGIFGKIAGLTALAYILGGIEVAAPLFIGTTGLKLWFTVHRYGTLKNFLHTWKFLIQPNPLPPPDGTYGQPDLTPGMETPFAQAPLRQRSDTTANGRRICTRQ